MSLKQDLQKLANDIETKKFREGEAKGLMTAIQEEQTKALIPVFEKLGENLSKVIETAIRGLTINVPEPKATPVDVRLPEMKMPDFPSWPAMPEIKIPKITIPDIKIPTIRVPEIKMPDSMTVDGQVSLKGVSRKTPLPVQLMGEDGKPLSINIPMMSGGGGRGDFFTIKDIQNSTGGSIIDNDGNLKVAGSFSVTSSTASTQLIDSSGLPYSAANPLPTTASVTLSAATGQGDSASALRTIQAGDSVSSVIVNSGTITAVTGITNSVAATLVDSSGVAYSGSNPLPTTASVTLSAATGQGDGASALRTIQAGDSVSSVVVNSGTITTVTTVTGITNTVMAVGDIASGALEDGSSYPVKIGAKFNSTIPTYTDGQRGDIQMGSRGSLNVTLMAVGSGNSIRANDDNSDAFAPTATSDKLTTISRNTIYDSSANQWNRAAGGNGVTNTGTLRTVQATDSVSSVVVNSGTVVVTSITNSAATALVDSGGVAYSGSNPVPITIVSGSTSSSNVVLTRQTNPTAVAADYVPAAADALGRTLVRPVQVRDLIATAYVTLSTGTEATLLTAAAGSYLDLIYIMGANSSGNAQQVDIRNTSGGNIVMSLYIPGNSTAGISLSVPFPQDATGNSWTVDMADVTNSNILISALFSKEV